MFDVFDFQNIDPQASTGTIIASAVYLLVLLIAQWKVFEKAGESGWKAIIPIYNLYTLCKIVDGSGIKCLLFLIPIVNVIYYILINLRTAKVFGKGLLFGIGLILFQPLFTLILGFGSARYKKF